MDQLQQSTLSGITGKFTNAIIAKMEQEKKEFIFINHRNRPGFCLGGFYFFFHNI